LKILDRVIAEHQIIRRNLQGVQSSVTDYDAFYSLQQAQSGLAQSAVEKLSEEKTNIMASLSRIKKGLDNHFAFEESALPPLFGEVFMKALLVVHAEIKEYMAKAIVMVEQAPVEGADQKEILDHKSNLQAATTNLGEMIEEHANLEEQMLRMLKKAFQGKAV
jgi:hypothetical protein